MSINTDFDQFLIDACYKLNISEIIRAIDKGANVNAVGKYKDFPLEACVEYQNEEDSKQIIEIIDILLKNGADINFQFNSNSKTLLMSSIQLLHSYDVVEFILNKGAQPNIKIDDERTVLDLISYEIDYVDFVGDKPNEVENLKKIYELLKRFGAKYSEDL